MRCVTLVVAIFFAAVGDASGKGPPLDRVEICGIGACRVAATAADGEAANVFFGDGVIVAPPAAPQSYYEIWAVYGGGDRRLVSFFVPAAAVLYRDDWNRLDSEELAPLEAAVASLEPWQTPTVTAAAVGGAAARDAASYVRLFTAGRLTSGWGGFGGWLRLDLRFDRSNPWASTEVRISRKRGFVWCDGWVFRIPTALAARARRGLPLNG